MSDIIVVTGVSSGFGALTALGLAHAGHTVYAAMRDTRGRNAPQAAEVTRYASDHGIDLRTVELDVTNEASVNAGIAGIIVDTGRLDVVIHYAGDMSLGPAEAFTPEQLAELYDNNVLSTQRVNRAALPQFRKQGSGLLVWISSGGARGGTPTYLAPYLAANAAMESLAVCYATELSRWGIETAIVVPGAFTKDTHHLGPSGKPFDTARAAQYVDGPSSMSPEQSLGGLTALEPADVGKVAEVIVEIVGMPCGTRPFRTRVDPSQNGADVVEGVAERVRAEVCRRTGHQDLLHAHGIA